MKGNMDVTRQAIMKAVLLSDTELSETPITVHFFGNGKYKIDLDDFPYGLEDHIDSLDKGIKELESQLRPARYCHYRDDSIILIIDYV